MHVVPPHMKEMKSWFVAQAVTEFLEASSDLGHPSSWDSISTCHSRFLTMGQEVKQKPDKCGA